MKLYLMAAAAAMMILPLAAESAPVDRGLQGGSYNAGRGGFNVGGQGGGSSQGRLQNDGGVEMGGGNSSWPGQTNQGGFSGGNSRDPSSDGYRDGD